MDDAIRSANATGRRRGRILGVAAGGLCVLGAAGFALERPPSIVAKAPIIVAARMPPATPPDPPARDPAEARVELGRKIFFDTGLSEPAGTSCATCHDPAHGYAGNNGSTTGVARGSRPDRFARRNTPSVLYLKFIRRFHLRWEEDADFPEASGGFFWDGRSDSLAALVQQPLLNPNEMGNRDLRAIARHLESSGYADALRTQFDGVFASPESAVLALGECVEAFLTSAEMSPFSSKYDEFLRGHEELSANEAKGLAVFKDHAKGACSSCHTMNDRSPMPERSLFTDYGYEVVAVPRNRKIASNADPRSFYLGVCERREHRQPNWHTEDDMFCGSFRTPSLRNVAVRTHFMHNGVFSSLRDVVAFYATRATEPKRWYAGGTFDDLPKRYWQYVNTSPAPYHRQEGEAPALDDGDVDALVAFLETLTDAQYRQAPPR
jgi:cytochrome c peroxidase